MKQDIVKLGHSPSGIPIYRFKYKEAFDPDGSGALSLDELNKQLRRGAGVELDAKLKPGAKGKIETKSQGKHALRKGKQTKTTSSLLRGMDIDEASDRPVAEQLRDALNDLANLNVTTRTINVWKRGPFTAALRRLNTDSLRDVTLEQLARQGRAAPLVDDGTWARIERAIVNSYDATNEALNELTALSSAAEDSVAQHLRQVRVRV